MKKFTEWLKERETKQQEACTDTGDIAHFVRPVIPCYRRRMYTDPVDMMKKENKK